MSGSTKIGRTRSDDGSAGATWNPVTGCSKVSEGCDHGYAETFAERWRRVPGHAFEQGFDVRVWPGRLEMPLRWRRTGRVFLNSMSDLWHEAVDAEFIARVFAVIALAEKHTFQVLTPRLSARLEVRAARSATCGCPCPGWAARHAGLAGCWGRNCGRMLEECLRGPARERDGVVPGQAGDVDEPDDRLDADGGADADHELAELLVG
jgi:hypothetical protein